MMKLKTILWEVNVPSEYIKSLFQEELNSDSFVTKKQQYRRRKNLLLCYRGIQFLLERKFKVFINITICQQVISPTLKEMVMEEYLSYINNDMMVCLLRAGTVVIRSKIWKHFLSVRDGLINKKMDNISMKSKKRSGKSKSKMPKADDITCWDKKPNANDNEGNTNINDTKC